MPDKAFIVDDHFDTADTMRSALTFSGYDAEAFTSFEECLKRITNESPCILFMDYHTPGPMNPLVFLSLVQSRFPHLKIVVVSADNRIRDKVNHLGAKFILKPVDLDQIQLMCAQHCSSHEK
jgi:DNA-binding NtrC family response regulator